ncbi:MAG: hypothetical protein LC799_17445, partial [Actinobacteria bacterium]|nr:hypothetical protein [Actinomycetota bacterium]
MRSLRSNAAPECAQTGMPSIARALPMMPDHHFPGRAFAASLPPRGCPDRGQGERSGAADEHLGQG